jgi:hypothetical protein
MRIEAAVTSISWIPSEAVAGATKLPFETGIAHYDPPPPDVIGDLEEVGGANPGDYEGTTSTFPELDVTRITRGDDGFVGTPMLELPELALATTS